MLSIPMLKGLIRSLEHKKGAGGAIATAGNDPEATSNSHGASELASLAARLDLDVLAVIMVPPGGKSAEITVAGRAGLTTSLAMPLLDEDRGMLARLILGGKPEAGRGKVFVTNQIFPRDGNWCDFLPLDSSLTFFFVPVRALPAVAERAVAVANMSVLAGDLAQAEPDCTLELKTYLAAALVALSTGPRGFPPHRDSVTPYEHFLKTQGYSLWFTDEQGNPVGSEETASGRPDARLASAVRQAVGALRRPSAMEAEPQEITLGVGGGLRAYAYPVQVSSEHFGYLVVAGARSERPCADPSGEWLRLLGRFTSGIAHEIKNPLTGIAAGVQYLAKRLQPGVVEADTVDFILAEIARLNRIVDDLYKIARPPQLVLKSTSVNDVVAKSLFCLSEEIVKKRLDLVQRAEKQIPTFQGDPERLQQVLINVIKNAIEASPEGGRIEITTGCAGDSLTVRVRDSGQGVPEADRAKVFEPFFSTKKGGTGLGLCISQAIVDEHGGKMWLETPPEGGAVFVIDLPVGQRHGKSTDC